jgi:ferredoxin
MPRLRIDNREVEVPPGATILDAAARLGIEIPTLCFYPGCEPMTSCLVCLVKINGGPRLVPACATAVAEGMVGESESDEVRAARRNALELLLSDHLGDCLAPCWFGCAAQMDIPKMLRQIAASDLRGAIATVKARIALPAVLGRICPAPCEKVCRRNSIRHTPCAADADSIRHTPCAADADSIRHTPCAADADSIRHTPCAADADGTRSVPDTGPVAICMLKRYVADVDLASPDPYLPPCKPPSGKRVAIIGGGPTGLSAAYYLAQSGHAVTIMEQARQLGGRLYHETTEEALPRDVLAAEIAQITRLGIEVRLGTRGSPAELCDAFDAVLAACGAPLECGDLSPLSTRAESVDKSPHSKIFVAGNAVRGKALVVRSVADGREAAVAIDQFIAGLPVTGAERPFSTRVGRMDQEELIQLAANSGGLSQFSSDEIGTVPFGVAAKMIRAAARCMHCDCRGLDTCKLRRYAAMYGADPRRYKGERRRFQQDTSHPDVIFEPGKCIDCGLCIQIAAAAGKQLGLTYIGRGFDVRIGVPLGHSLAEALQNVAAAQCIAACPTAALAWKTEHPQGTADERG